MDTMLFIVLAGIVCLLVANLFRPQSQPHIIYIETAPNPNADLGCLPLLLIGLAVLVFALISGS